jgi:hypothetical protein
VLGHKPVHLLLKKLPLLEQTRLGEVQKRVSRGMSHGLSCSPLLAGQSVSGRRAELLVARVRGRWRLDGILLLSRVRHGG